MSAPPTETAGSVSDVEMRLAAALEHHQAGRREQAEQIYAEVLAGEPDEPTALYLSGLLAFETGRPVEAVTRLQRVTQLKPQQPQGWATLAAAYHWLGRHAEAAEAYRAVLALDRGYAAALVGLANVLAASGERADALDAARIAVLRLPQSAPAHIALGAALAADAQLPAAAEAYEEAIWLDPDTADGHLALALTRVQLAQGEAALAAADRAVELDPGAAGGWFARGAAMALLQQDELAIPALERALALDPRWAAAHHSLGNAYTGVGRVVEAEASLKRAVELTPAPSRPYASLGALYRRMSRPAEARRCYEAALGFEPDMMTAHVNLAALLTEAGETRQAAVHADAAYNQQNLFVDGAEDAPLRVLVLIAVGNGNVPLHHLLDPARYRRIQWFIAYMRPGQAAELPDYDLVFNAIGEPDRVGPAEANAAAFLETVRRPVLNLPARVLQTARHLTPARLAGLADVVTPKAVRISADDLGPRGLAGAVEAAGLTWPVLARPLGSHGGTGVLLATSPQALDAFPLAAGEAAYFTAFHDFRSADGFYRKYRMLFVDRRPYPYHLAISKHWMVHHASADMAADAWRMEEELRFLADPEAAIGARALAAVGAIARRLDLDYAGLDFSVLPDGQVLVFEANATMLIHPEPPEGLFARKNPYIQNILDAFDTHLISVASGALAAG